MSDNSKIEWTDATWNPVRGCTKISPGCMHCYAETLMERFRGVPGHPYEHGFDLRLAEDQLDKPRTWRKPRRIFVCSMSDLFQEGVPWQYHFRVWKVMKDVFWHDFQVLTKRARTMREFANRLPNQPVDNLRNLPNVWLGVSVEDRKYGVPRIDELRRTEAAVRYLSIEPLLEDLNELDLTNIHWVIAGCESRGPGLGRPADLDWFRNIRDQCVAAGVPFFLKQAGLPNAKGKPQLVKMPELDGKVWAEMP